MVRLNAFLRKVNKKSNLKIKKKKNENISYKFNFLGTPDKIL